MALADVVFFVLRIYDTMYVERVVYLYRFSVVP